MTIKKVILQSLHLSVACLIFIGFCDVTAYAGPYAGKSSFPCHKIKTKITLTDTGWRQLFNGRDLGGWKQVGPGSRYVKNGLTGSHGGMGLLYYTKEKFGNCIIRVVYKMQNFNSNSGVFVRIPIEPREPWMPVFYGYEVQIDNHPETSKEDEYHITGTLYSLTKPLAKPGKPGPEWNTMEITLDGPRTLVYVNGKKVTDYTEGGLTPPRKFDYEPYRGLRPNSGYIGLQNHGDNDIVFFREVSVKPLKRNNSN